MGEALVREGEREGSSVQSESQGGVVEELSDETMHDLFGSYEESSTSDSETEEEDDEPLDKKDPPRRPLREEEEEEEEEEDEGEVL